MAGKVTRIPATIRTFNNTTVAVTKKRKVAAYARVSTDHEDQQSSYEAQVDYYTRYIQGRSDWEFVKVYADEGISGTSTKHRKGFKEMIQDALDGKIDLILTKSVSRFSRNTVDCLNNIRLLKENGVEVSFEKENINTFDSKGELLLTIMGSLAQEESRSISQNCTWGQRKRFKDGKATVPFTRFLGYDKGPNGEFVVNKDEAEVVRFIYREFINGNSCARIARTLTERGIKSPGGKDKWNTSAIRSILQNEKYKGDARLQKTYTVDYLTKKKAKNNGELESYYVTGHHEAIISPEAYAKVQTLLSKRSTERISTSGLFASKVKCSCCGAWYGKKVWHSTDEKYRKEVYRCNKMFDGDKCDSPIFTEDELKEIVVKAVNKLYEIKDDVLATFLAIKDELDDFDEENKKLEELSQRLDKLLQEQTDHLNKLKTSKQDIELWHSRNDEIEQEINNTKKEIEVVQAAIREKETSRLEINEFVDNLKAINGEITKFSDDLLFGLIERIEAGKEKVDVVFKNVTVISL